MNKNFCQRFIKSSEKNADKIGMRVVGVESEVFTFGEMLRQIRSVAYRLKLENIEFGDRVVVIGENHPCWAIAYLAALYHGAVCVPLDPHGEIETLINFFENSEAKLVFLSPETKEKFQKIQPRLKRRVKAVVWRDNALLKPQKGDEITIESGNFESFEDWAQTEFPESFAEANPPADFDDIALLIYTSGTTGTPKGVPLTHGNICAELDGINEVLQISEKDSILSLLPLFHAYLQIVNLWVATTYGCEAGYLKELSPAELSDAMKKFKPTILTTVPRLWYLFHKKIFDAVSARSKAFRIIFRLMLIFNGFLRDTFKINLGKKFFGKIHDSFGGRIRFAITAGSRFDEAVAMDFHRLGFTIIQGYGLTETSGAATATYETDNRVGSVGKPFINAEIKIDEPDKKGVGEVLIRGAMVFKGYYKNEAATCEAFTEDGWFRSGDLGTFDADGNLFIVGRAKDVIVLPSGKNIHPEDLEVHYLKTPLVEELAILGVNDEKADVAGAEKLIAVVVPNFEYLRKTNIAISKEAIRHELDGLGRALPEYQRVRNYLIRTEPLPRTATRKIKRFQLQKEIEANGFDSNELSAAKTLTLSDEDTKLLNSLTGEAIVKILRQNSKDAETIHPQMNLEIDLGLDSLGRAEVFAAIEQAFQIEFEAGEATRAFTVADIINLTEKHNGDSETEITDVDFNWSKIIGQANKNLPEIRYVLRNRKIFPFTAYAFFKSVNIAARILLRMKVEGAENLDQIKRPFLICPNHQSFLDPFIVTSLGSFDTINNSFAVGASEFFKTRIMQYIGRMMNVVPINPDAQLMQAMKAGAAGLKSGKILNIFPEGERAFDGELHTFKKGAAILATELDLPIVPVALDGLYKVWARKSRKIRLAKIKVKIGAPFYAKDILGETSSFENQFENSRTGEKTADARSTSDSKYEIVTAHLKQTIQSMIDEMRK